MTFNIENGGTQVSFDNVVHAIKLAKADIVGIQEAWGNTKRLAQALGWPYYDTQLHLVSKFPLYTDADHRPYDLVEVSTNYFVAISNLHLPDEPYGPDLIRKGSSVNEIIQHENITRLPFALPYINSLQRLAIKGFPVFIIGDFNSPSHQDWSYPTVNVIRNHRYAVSWPVTKTLQAKGFIDAYRAINPDPLLHPGNTWPSDRPALVHAIDNYNPSTHDLPDRLDMIFSSGPATAVSSRVIAQPKPWPSDHYAVVAQFIVTPHALAKLQLKPVVAHTGKPAIQAFKQTYTVNEPIYINWMHSPANGYDYIRLIPTGSEQSALDNATRFYTSAKPCGMIMINAHNIQGNWPSWANNSAARWPLAPGHYSIELMLDDGNQILASSSITISKN